MNHGRPWFRISVLALGYLFLYLPIVLLIAFSFNKSRLVTVWGGFSTHWYGALFRNQQILDAAWLSVRVGALSATLAVALGSRRRGDGWVPDRLRHPLARTRLFEPQTGRGGPTPPDPSGLSPAPPARHLDAAARAQSRPARRLR